MILRLLRAPVLPLFVFDDPNRPATKHNKELKIMENSQLNDIRKMIIAFGFECVTVSNLSSHPLFYLMEILKAPGEAKAALT